MAQDTIAAVRPLTDFVDLVDIPLCDFLPVEATGMLEGILVSEVWTDLDDSNFTLGAKFYLGGIADLHLPGLDQFSLSFNEDALATGVLVCGDEPSMQIEDVEITLQVAPAILRAVDGTGAEFKATCGVRFDREGFHFLEFGETSLADARIAGTEIAISLAGIHLDTTSDTFLRIRSGTLTLPMFTDAADAPLVLEGRDLSFSRDGPSGIFERRAGPALEFRLYDFACEIDDARIALEHGQLTEVALNGRIDLGKFLADGREDGWVKVTFSVGPEGLVAALADDEPIIDMTVDGMFQLDVDTIRLEAGAPGAEGVLWLSGNLTPQIDDVEGGWPTFAFDEIGIGPNGGLRLAEGATIATTQPFVLSWNFLNLTVTAFSLQRPDDDAEALELRITTAVELVAGLPAGASVDGLVVRKDRHGVSVRFNGIGISFGTPGGYSFEASISWDGARLSGTGHLDIPSLDMRLDVVVAAASEPVVGGHVTTFFLAAEAELVPGGIPIGTTGLSLYGVSGLLAHNLALKLPNAGPRRFFDAFMEAPEGSFAARSKWDPAEGAHALGLGVLIGTADDGWMFSARGALMVSIPDLSILLTATGELLHERQGMNAKGEGKLAALLAVYPAEQLLRLDFSAQWNSEPLFDVQGAGGGEFHGDRPFDCKVWLGQPPADGPPVAARALKLDSKWLFNAEYWLGLDAGRQANIGFRTHLELRAGVDALYAELVGHAGGQVTLAWNPSQIEGDFSLGARARLVAGGLSLGFSLSAGIDVRIARPTLLEIPLRSCIEIDLGFDSFEICLSFTFRWRKEDTPKLPPLVHGLSAVPRHWAPRIQPSPETPIDNGIVHHLSDVDGQTIDLGLVAPHSELVLELSKSMFVDPAVLGAVKLNDVATPYPQQIGHKSDWLAKWSIVAIELRDTTLGAPVDLFGTFSRSPLARENGGKATSPRLPNTELRLLSSRRFGQDGSLGGGGAEETPPSDCGAKPTKVTQCISLAGLSPGFGILPNGWLYQWRSYPEFPRRSDNRYGVGLGGEDSFRFWPPLGIDSVELTSADYIPRQPPVAGTERTTVHPVVDPDPVDFHAHRRILLTLCWEQLIGDDGSGGHQDWHGSSGIEEWTLTADKRLLTPGHDYLLRIGMAAQLQRGDNDVGAPIPIERSYAFIADRAPEWEGGLSRGIAAHYPDDGRRPVYRDYDLFVLFKDDFFNALYTLDKRRLGVRLRGTDGEPVATAAGEVFLPTAWETGAVKRSPVEDWWIRARAGNPVDPCEAQTPLPTGNGDILLPISLKDLKLKPETRYIAELVAVDAGAAPTNPTPPLAEWSFTTSRFGTFEEMVTPPNRVPSFGLAVGQAPPADDFDALIRAFGAPVVSVVANVRMTPVRVGNNFAYLLIEAPEPLDDGANRLTVTVDTQTAPCVFNLDKTRAIAVLAAPLALSVPAQVVDVTLVWERAPQAASREMRRTVGGDTDAERVTWPVPLKGLFG